MENRLRGLKIFSILVIFYLVFVGCDTKEQQPGIRPEITGTWTAWESYEAAGWSEERIRECKSFWEGLDSAAVVVVYQGRVLLAWGSYQVNYWTHSARKSFMSAIYGIYVDRGAIDLDKTLADLGIDDEPSLTEDEKRAKVIHLLQARSGVYHTAAAETQGMHDYKPDRGTYDPGEFWCYNNWDFNALATIFDQETGTTFFQALYQDLNLKLGMEDYLPEENQYQYDLERSIHPAYIFAISARDAARFGLLFLQNGIWNGEQIIPSQWVLQSTAPVSDAGDYVPGTFYGYMWWIYPRGYGAESGWQHLSNYMSYAALGAYGQVIQVIPDMELVFVHRVDSYNNKNVRLSTINQLLDMILGARN